VGGWFELSQFIIVHVLRGKNYTNIQIIACREYFHPRQFSQSEAALVETEFFNGQLLIDQTTPNKEASYV